MGFMRLRGNSGFNARKKRKIGEFRLCQRVEIQSCVHLRF